MRPPHLRLIKGFKKENEPRGLKAYRETTELRGEEGEDVIRVWEEEDGELRHLDVCI